ncbi:MAG: hypothetical protein K9I94_01205 [Bacteroidales bacterium]|nr:hypothetical protein [Bacteroidales bacterium]
MYRYIFLLLIPLFVACGQSGDKKKLEELKQQNQMLKARTETQDSVINMMASSFNNIEENLATIRAKENVITRSTSGNKELAEDARNRINRSISIINSLMEQNRNTIESLEQQLKKSKYQNSKVRRMLNLIRDQLHEKEAEIVELKKKLGKLNIKVDDLNARVDYLKEQNTYKDKIINEQIDKLNKVYYAYGTKKNLRKTM